VFALANGSGKVMFIEEVDPSTNQPTDTYMLIPVIEKNGEYEFDSSLSSDVNLSQSEAQALLGSDATAIVNYPIDSTEFGAILAAEGASHSPSYSYSVRIEAPAEIQLLEPVANDDDIGFVTDIA
jgi:hypothetical protein